MGALLVVVPWTARNYHEYRRLVLIASEGGITFWTGNHPLAHGEGDMAANPAIKLDNQRLRAAHPGSTRKQLEPIYYREAFGAIARDPLWWLSLLGAKGVLHDGSGGAVIYSPFDALSGGVGVVVRRCCSYAAWLGAVVVMARRRWFRSRSGCCSARRCWSAWCSFRRSDFEFP